MTDLLQQVIARLNQSDEPLTEISAKSGINYDTLLRIKNQENDPGYSKVRRLADYLGVNCTCS